MVEQEELTVSTSLNNDIDVEEQPSTRGKTPVPAQTPQKNKRNTRYYLNGLGFLIILAISLTIATFIYVRTHGINLFDLVQYPENTLTFSFIGGSRTPISIGVEIFFWSLMGVMSKMAYLSGRVIIRGQFEFWKYLIRWISTSMFAQGVSTAVIFSLSIVALSVAGIKITLENASIETIIAISFVLSFYHDETVRILDKLRGKIAFGEKEESIDEHDNSQ